MAYNNYCLEKNKCKCCWMKREQPETYKKINDGEI